MHDLSLYALELIENSIRARATVVLVDVEFDRHADLLTMRVEDDGEGTGVSSDVLFDPFYTTKGSKRVGLGLSLFKDAVEAAGGRVTLFPSCKLRGLAVEAAMHLTHVNRPPMGDFGATFGSMILANPSVDFQLCVRSAERLYSFKLGEFVRDRSMDVRANVDVAAAVFSELRAELEVWRRYDLMCSKERWRTLIEEPCQHASDNNLEEGAGA